MAFDRYIGINYSGAETPTSRMARLQVYAVTGGGAPKPVTTPAAPEGQHWNWSRREIAEWLIGLARSKTRFIAGIDHAFSFPVSYFDRYKLKGWDQFLDDFGRHWPTDDPHVYVDFVRERDPPRSGGAQDYRLVEVRASPARSVFRFEGHACIAKSTHAGLPWLRKIRREAGDRLHFWPFDGWDIPAGKSVLAEVDPSLLRNRDPMQGRTAHQHTAYSVARWLSEIDRQGALDQFLHPPLTDEERTIAAREGWILGVPVERGTAAKAVRTPKGKASVKKPKGKATRPRAPVGRTTPKAPRQAHSPLVGRWRITWIEQWDQSFVDAEVEGSIRFDRDGSGEFQFGYVHGNISYQVTEHNEKPAVVFTFEGNDEMDPCSGRGWAFRKGDRIGGKLVFHGGDASKFKAEWSGRE
jgi:hypothetical protein